MQILWNSKINFQIKQRIYLLYSRGSAIKSALLKSFMFEQSQLASYWRLDAETTIPPNFPPTICGREKVRKFWDNVYTTRARERGKNSGGENGRGRKGKDRKARFDHRYSWAQPAWWISMWKNALPRCFPPCAFPLSAAPLFLFAREQPCRLIFFEGGHRDRGPVYSTVGKCSEPAR